MQNPGQLSVQINNYLIREQLIPADRVIGGMLHPSGNCTYRINYLTGERRGDIPHATNPEPYDRGRDSFRRHYIDRPGLR